MNSSQVLAEVRPARAEGARDLPALETVLASLALDARSPIALEIAATATTRQFLLRAEQAVALRHLAQQVQARYPQTVISSSVSDPLALSPGEEWSVVELRAGAASSLPLRSWKARELTTEGTDPLLGLLAAFGSLPAGTRAIAQLALLPASPTWSASHRRDAIEHPLAHERTQTRGGTPERSLSEVLRLLPVVLLLLLLFLFRRWLPPWLTQAAGTLLRGQTPHLTPTELLAVIMGGALLLLLLLGGTVLALLLASRVGSRRLSDQRLVQEKTARPAYRVRLRLWVIAPGDASSSGEGMTTLRGWRRLVQRVRAVWRTLDELGRAPLGWSEIHQQWRAWRTREKARRSRRGAREEVVRMLVAAYRQYHLASGGYFVPRHLSTRRVRRLLAPSRKRWGHRQGWSWDLARSAHYLSVADLAALWHLPQAQDAPDLAYVERHPLRSLLAPTVLSTIAGYQLGVSTHAGQTVPVRLPFACLSRNLLAVASTGKGKSSLFVQLMAAFAQGRLLHQPDLPDGALLIDPHGDLVAQVAGSLPSELVDEVVLIDLADRTSPIAFNPLDMSGGKDRDKTIDHLIQVIEALWPTSYGPRTESFLEYSCKTLAEANLALIADDPLTGPDRQYTLLDVMALFSQSSFRHAVLEQVHDPHLRSWWHQYYERLDERQQADFASSLLTKLAKFSSSRLLRRILGQPRSSLDLGEIIRQNRIVLFSCAAGEVGADMAALFGSLFVGFFQAALQEQGRLHPAERHRFLVLIDEFQALAGINYQSMLAELRKYGGTFALATQSLAYLDRFARTLRATVMANIDQVFAFAMAEEDARLLRVPGVEPEDVIQLPDYTCYVRLALSGERLPVFSLRLDAPPAGSATVRHDLAARCRARYGRPVGEVDALLEEGQKRREGMPEQAPVWEKMGVETVAEVAESIKNRKRGKGGRKPMAEGGIRPEHVMYEASAGEKEGSDGHDRDDLAPE